MEPSSVKDLIELARSDAPLTLSRGRDWLSQLEETDHESRSKVYRAMCIAARYASTMDDSVSFGEESVNQAELSGDHSVRSWAMITLAGSLALMGHTDGALTLLGSATSIASREELGVIHVQRGLVLGMRGETEDALAAFSTALPILDEIGDQTQSALTLHNRGLLQVLRGDLEAAEADLLKARDLHIAHGLEHLLSGAEHNLGLLAAHRGDIPEALRRFSASEELERRQTGSAVPVHVSRCEVLLSAGLFREALDLAVEIYQQHKRRGRGEDEAEARLVAAQAALLSGDAERASILAQSAVAMFQGQGQVGWVAAARRVWVQARHEQGMATKELLGEARVVADELEGGLSIPARNAHLTAGLIALDLGETRLATVELLKVARFSSGPVELRLQSWHAMARLRLAQGSERAADAAARAGLRLLDEYQAALGASDIRFGVERHVAALASLGLDLALKSGRGRRVYSWMERAHVGALDYRPATPTDDLNQVRDLARLRRLMADMRKGVLVADAVTRDVRDLQEAIRNRARQTRGGSDRSDRVTLTSLADELLDHTLVELASHDGTLWAVVVRNGRFQLREIGSEPAVVAELESLRFIMRRLTRRRGSIDSAREVANRLDTILFGSLKLAAAPLVIVPPARLHATPWWALPTCQRSAVTISPSAELWYRAGRRAPGHGFALIVAGPELAFSDSEAKAVASLYQGSTFFPSKKSDVGVIQSHLDGAGIAHIASHAFFRYENPMFSSLRLADGDLYVYDIERLKVAPEVVVLSACDSGFTETHAGDELMGLSSALLSMGTRSIIASVGLVPDSAATKDLMVALHRGLVSGLSPSLALHRAQTEAAETPEGYIAASSFICIGAG